MTLLYCKHLCNFRSDNDDEDVDDQSIPYLLPKALHILKNSLGVFQGTQFMIPIVFYYSKLVIKHELNQCYGSAEACLRLIVQILGLDQNLEDNSNNASQVMKFSNY